MILYTVSPSWQYFYLFFFWHKDCREKFKYRFSKKRQVKFAYTITTYPQPTKNQFLMIRYHLWVPQPRMLKPTDLSKSGISQGFKTNKIKLLYFLFFFSLLFLAASFCFHDHETRSDMSTIHFSRVLQHGSLHALLYTVFPYKYNESIDKYETLD